MSLRPLHTTPKLTVTISLHNTLYTQLSASKPSHGKYKILCSVIRVLYVLTKSRYRIVRTSIVYRAGHGDDYPKCAWFSVHLWLILIIICDDWEK